MKPASKEINTSQSKADTTVKELMLLKRELQRVVDAWDVLPPGQYHAKVVGGWMNGPMKAAITRARKALNA